MRIAALALALVAERYKREVAQAAGHEAALRAPIEQAENRSRGPR
jgi:hypothetical protein